MHFSLSECARAIVVVGCAVWLVASGCVTTSETVSPGVFRTPYAVSQVYEVVQEVFLVQLRTADGWKTRAERPGKHQDVPSTVSAYRAAVSQWPQVLGVVPSGSRVTISELRLTRNPTLGNAVYVFGKLNDGIHAGKEIDLTFISEQVTQSAPPALVPTPDPALLTLVDTL